MRILFAAALALAASAAIADPVARNANGDWIRLLNAECSPEVAALIPENVREYFSKGAASVGGQPFAACWAMRPDGQVWIFYSDSEQGLVPARAFNDEPTA